MKNRIIDRCGQVVSLLFLITKNLSGWDKTWSCTKVWTHTLPYIFTFLNISRCTRKLFTKAIHIRTPLNCYNAFTETDSLLITHRHNLTWKKEKEKKSGMVTVGDKIASLLSPHLPSWLFPTALMANLGEEVPSNVCASECCPCPNL